MKPVEYGRKIYRFGQGESFLTGMSVTEKPDLGESEKAFVERLLTKYRGEEGTIEIVIKKGLPSHAIVMIFSQ